MNVTRSPLIRTLCVLNAAAPDSVALPVVLLIAIARPLDSVKFSVRSAYALDPPAVMARAASAAKHFVKVLIIDTSP